jgi:hypothetical protein
MRREEGGGERGRESGVKTGDIYRYKQWERNCAGRRRRKVENSKRKGQREESIKKEEDEDFRNGRSLRRSKKKKEGKEEASTHSIHPLTYGTSRGEIEEEEEEEKEELRVHGQRGKEDKQSIGKGSEKNFKEKESGRRRSE